MTVQRDNHSTGQRDPLASALHLTDYPVILFMLVLLVAALVFPQGARAECKEFKIVEYEDRVEAVCVGEPLTEAQKKANLEEEKRQEALAQRQRVEEQKRQREIEAANKAQNNLKAAEERKKNNKLPDMPQKPVNKNSNNPNILSPNRF